MLGVTSVAGGKIYIPFFITSIAEGNYTGF
jgi:hypothetical protein